MIFPQIKVPDDREGLSQSQRDRLLIEMSQAINYWGSSICKNKTAIYGDEDSPGLKKLSHSPPCQPCKDNRDDIKGVYDRLWWLIGALISAGVIGGGLFATGGI